MFRCQFSGEVSDGPVFGYATVTDPSTERQKKIWTKVKEGEKPVRIAVEFRDKTYVNYYRDSEGNREEVITHGREIVKELLIRPKHLDAVKKKYGV